MPKLLPGGRAVGVRPGVEVHHPRVLSTRVVRRLDIGRRPSKHAIESYFRVSEKRRCQMAAEKFRQWGWPKEIGTGAWVRDSIARPLAECHCSFRRPKAEGTRPARTDIDGP
jgi:hypothetical protein